MKTETNESRQQKGVRRRGTGRGWITRWMGREREKENWFRFNLIGMNSGMIFPQYTRQTQFDGIRWLAINAHWPWGHPIKRRSDGMRPPRRSFGPFPAGKAPASSRYQSELCRAKFNLRFGLTPQWNVAILDNVLFWIRPKRNGADELSTCAYLPN